MMAEQIEIKPGQLWTHQAAMFIIVRPSRPRSLVHWLILWADTGDITETNRASLRDYAKLLQDV